MKRGIQNTPATSRDRARYWALRNAGLCVDCRQPHPDTTARCANCLKTRRAQRDGETLRPIPAPPLPPERQPRERRFVTIEEHGCRVEMEVVWP